MMNLLRCSLLILGLGAGSCAPFYQATLPSAPLVRHRGEVAVIGSWLLSETGQATVAWSPVEHVRLGGTITACHSGEASPDSSDTYSYLRSRAYQVDAGYYFGVSQGRGVVEVSGSVGKSRSLAHGDAVIDPFSYGSPVPGGGTGGKATRGLPDQIGEFRTVAGQVSGLWDREGPGSRQTGLLLRLSRVECTRLTFDGQELARPANWYIEPAGLFRTKGQGLRAEFQLGYTLGLVAQPNNSVFPHVRPRVAVSLLAFPVVIYRKFKD
ncbi:hypothetical protein [Hymenobacter persicinus]|uniref:DUF3575 domain-containing protein n=1 Tax=Hymenobacter persicinus TaxID=2025506 RepID=A0A4Q5LDC5_9BACT|nr:hypothetical protein [Hymenobacter persicinus]RYU81551.1 hypothetical protein EWM57_06020 [Hymenobacter persicinus]